MYLINVKVLKFAFRTQMDIADKVPWREELRSFRHLLDHFDDIVLRSPSILSSAEECYSGKIFFSHAADL